MRHSDDPPSRPPGGASGLDARRLILARRARLLAAALAGAGLGAAGACQPCLKMQPPPEEGAPEVTIDQPTTPADAAAADLEPMGDEPAQADGGADAASMTDDAGVAPFEACLSIAPTPVPVICLSLPPPQPCLKPAPPPPPPPTAPPGACLWVPPPDVCLEAPAPELEELSGLSSEGAQDPQANTATKHDERRGKRGSA